MAASTSRTRNSRRSSEELVKRNDGKPLGPRLPPPCTTSRRASAGEDRIGMIPQRHQSTGRNDTVLQRSNGDHVSPGTPTEASSQTARVRCALQGGARVTTAWRCQDVRGRDDRRRRDRSTSHRRRHRGPSRRRALGTIPVRCPPAMPERRLHRARQADSVYRGPALSTKSR